MRPATFGKECYQLNLRAKTHDLPPAPARWDRCRRNA